jgi:hypothetical protein
MVTSSLFKKKHPSIGAKVQQQPQPTTVTTVSSSPSRSNNHHEMVPDKSPSRDVSAVASYINTSNASTSLHPARATMGGHGYIAPATAAAVVTTENYDAKKLKQKQSSYKRKFGQKVEVSHNIFLEGKTLEEYCNKRGLCPLCATTKVRKCVFKLFKKNEWEPITQLTKDGTAYYLVYKGFCVKPDCFTLEQAKRLAGDLKGDGKQKSGILKGSTNSLGKEPNRRTIPRDRYSTTLVTPTPPFFIDESDHQSDSQRGEMTHRRVSSAYPALQVKQQLQYVPPPTPEHLLPLVENVIQGLHHDDSLHQIRIMDLSGVTIMRPNDIEALLTALKSNTTLLVLNLENCKLTDIHMKSLGHGLCEAKDLPLQKLYLRSNDIHDDGVDSLCIYLKSCHCLETLDLSRNHIGTVGAVAIFDALQSNGSVKIKAINLSHNELWDVQQDTRGIRGFLAKNRTLKNLNLEGNYLHNEGAEALFGGLQQAGEYGTLQRLYLGWNSIGDDGAGGMY